MHNSRLGTEGIEQVAQPYFAPLNVGGEVFDLGHLQAFTFEFESQSLKKWLRVHVTFSNHCFTKGYGVEQHVPGEPIIDEFTPRPRLFCPIRYRLSKSLPELIRGMNHPAVKVFETVAERNWAYSIKIEDPDGPYHVFLEVRRPPAVHRHLQDVNLVIESAYHEDPEKGPPRLRGRMGFLLLCSNVFANKKTSTQR